MRASPTLSVSATTDWAFEDASGTPRECSALTLGLSSTPRVAAILGTVGSFLVAGNAAVFVADNTTNARLKLDARL